MKTEFRFASLSTKQLFVTLVSDPHNKIKHILMTRKYIKNSTTKLLRNISLEISIYPKYFTLSEKTDIRKHIVIITRRYDSKTVKTALIIPFF
jgi:hypothetical protein